ncbi:MAG TPA: NAD(P)/FAD-dependent oxidoreductase [Gemmatimonadaceae bacterium]
MSLPSPSPHPTIVILGAGFGGLHTARRLDALLKRRRSPEANVVLIDRRNYFLMTPLLFEAGSGVLEPRHTVSPIRRILRRVRFVQANIGGVDLDRRTVSAAPVGGGPEYEIPYDQLVLALGGTSDTAALPGADRVLTFKSLSDAIRLRNHTINLFERADAEPDPERKRRMLTFVVIGGGLVGTELAGEMADFQESIARSYPRIDRRQLRLELVQGGERLMPEMDASLATYATRVLEGRGVRVRVETRVTRIDFGERERTFAVDLSRGEGPIEACTVVAANGVRVNPVLDPLRLDKDRKGRVLTDATMRSTSRPEVWALGDCAHVPAADGRPYPQLAQHAMREAKALSRNLVAALRGQPATPFVYRTKGTLASLGHRKGVGRIGRFHVRGFIAWWIWRTFYLLQMPRWNRRVRIAFDWTISLLFKNDIVELDVQTEPRPPAQVGAAGVQERPARLSPVQRSVLAARETHGNHEPNGTVGSRDAE